MEEHGLEQLSKEKSSELPSIATEAELLQLGAEKLTHNTVYDMTKPEQAVMRKADTPFLGIEGMCYRDSSKIVIWPGSKDGTYGPSFIGQINLSESIQEKVIQIQSRKVA